MPLSDTQRQILAAAAQHDARLAAAPSGLPAAARNAVFRSMLKQNLLTEITAPAEYVGLGWRQDEAGEWIALRLTEAGLHIIGADGSIVAARLLAGTMPAAARSASPAAAGAGAVDDGGQSLEAAEGPSTGQHGPYVRRSLRNAAKALLSAWDAAEQQGLAEAVAALRGGLPARTGRPPRQPGAPLQPRQGTKQEQVLALLRRPEGATVAQNAEATGWQPHTVRGFFAGVKKRQGIAVEAAERIRQVGPDKQGRKGQLHHLPHRRGRLMRPALHGTARLAVGLYRVATAEQGQSGLGREAQQASIRAFAMAQGWTLVAEHSDIVSGKDDLRPGFQAALARCRQLGAVLVAARLGRITRRAHTLSGRWRKATRSGRRIGG